MFHELFEAKLIMKPTVVIGDVHGLSNWKEIVTSHSNYNFIFLGDYLDPYRQISSNYLIKNLNEIIEFKRSRMDDVTLLLGNHDLHYFSEDIERGSRYDEFIAERAAKIFTNHLGLFTYALQCDNRIFTHAGISHQWFIEDFKGDITQNIAEQLNHPVDNQMHSLCRVGYNRGGWRGNIGGIFWADIDELTDPLHGFTQIVGHNRVRKIIERGYDNDNKIIFCDSLFKGNFYVIEE